MALLADIAATLRTTFGIGPRASRTTFDASQNTAPRTIQVQDRGGLLALEVPRQLAIVDGDVSPNPGGPGARAFSSVLNVSMEWTGSRWRVADVPACLSAVRLGDTVVIPLNHILLVYGDFVADGDLVIDGELIIQAD